MPGTRMVPARITAVLAGMTYPARTWQLIAQADYCGDVPTRIELGRLPVGTYASLDEVLAALREHRPPTPPNAGHANDTTCDPNPPRGSSRSPASHTIGSVAQPGKSSSGDTQHQYRETVLAAYATRTSDEPERTGLRERLIGPAIHQGNSAV